jgi:hypothetical protein
MESRQRGTQSKDNDQRRTAQYGMYGSALLNCCNMTFGTRRLVSKRLGPAMYTTIVVALYRTHAFLFGISSPAFTCVRGQQHLACEWLVWLGGRRDSFHVQVSICIHSIPTNVKVIT